MGQGIKKIALIADSEGYGGLAKSTERLTTALVGQGENATAFYIPSGKFGFLQSYVKFFRTLQRFDILILMHFPAILMGICLRIMRLQSCKINVIHTDLVGFYQQCSWFKKGVLRLLIHCIRNEKIVFVSYEAAERAQTYFNLSDVLTIYNLVDEFIDPMEKNGQGSVQKKQFSFGCIARLHENKNIDVLIKVFAAVAKQYPAGFLTLKIYGDGPEYARLKDYAAGFLAQNVIQFYGYVDDVKTIYPSLDAVVSLSSIEGLPLVILEGLGHGKPIFHTACPCGPMEILNPNVNHRWQENQWCIRTRYGFLLRPEPQVQHYVCELSEYQHHYVTALVSFIEYYLHHTIEQYDFSQFSQEKIVQKWQQLIRGE